MKINKKYISSLKYIASLSPLFSDSDIPYVNYRSHEKIFCKAFNAVDLCRSDIAIDAKIGNIGYGLKTFICKSKNNRTLQKIAEFNKLSSKLVGLNDYEIVKNIIEWRNDRIEFSNQTYGIDYNKYHCLVRQKDKIGIYEEDLETISKDFRIISSNKSSIKFNAGGKNYTYSRSKSTLLKEFIIDEEINMYEVETIKDASRWINENANKGLERIILPLYSERDGNVPEKSQLNQWNAGGRARHPLEVYIPIPAKLNSNFPNFFPKKDKAFDLELPNGKIISAKVCQENNKALMSNPNKALGEWLLKDLFKLEENELMTMEKLNIIGIDSVEIIKSENKYEIDFCETGSYKEFVQDL